MNDVYLVEIRLGRTKWRVRETITAIAGISGLEPFMERHPHVTLFGPMVLQDGVSEQQVLDTIGSVAARYDPVPFMIDRFERREGMHGSVIAFSVIPSDQFRLLTAEIAGALLPITCSQNAWDDSPEKKWYHVTVANHLRSHKADFVFSTLPDPDGVTGLPARPSGRLSRVLYAIRSFFRSGKTSLTRPLLLDETGIRITVMHGEEILAEYDLLEKRWVQDGFSHDGRGWAQSLARFRRYAGFERTGLRPSSSGEVFLIGDLHLGHAKIIRYCSRPFPPSNPGEMDRVLIANWNAVVSPGSTVYHLGDLRYGASARPAGEYRAQLNGEGIFIAGNHDGHGSGDVSSTIIGHGGKRFFLIHDPADAPAGFDGWIVHGHHHNNDLRRYPFIDFEHRRINVSAEVIGYVPVSLEDICRLIDYRTATGNTRPVLLSYPYPE